MKHRIKRIGAILVAALLAMTTCITAFAATPASSDKATVTVKDVETGATVTGYKIVKADYSQYGLLGYSTAEGVTIADVSAPTEDEIAAIVQGILAGTLQLDTLSFSEVSTGYTAMAEAGTYLVLVTDSQTGTVYNPMLVSASYDEDSVIQGGEVSSQDNYVLNGQTVYAKSAQPSIDKIIVDSENNDHGDSAAFGDTVDFKITTVIPDYSKAYTSVVFKITDRLSAGLKQNNDFTVLINGEEESNAVSITSTDDTVVFTFDSDFVLAHGNAPVVITYSAVLNGGANYNFDPYTNIAKLQYSNDPDVNSDPAETEAKTYTYTFALDSSLSYYYSSSTEKTHELIKVNEDGSVTTTTVNDGIDTIDVRGALQGATFTLDNVLTGKKYTATSDANGYLSFIGLDEGDYALVETAAPDGYTVSTQVHDVNISAEYNPDGTLSSYTVTIDGEQTGHYSAVYGADGGITKILAEDETVVIKNTKIKELPSTGGIGTYVFTIVGTAMILTAAGLFIAYKKKRS